MRIVIDMQGAQTGSRFRGIGRYTINFAKAAVRNRGEHEIILALSGLLPDSIDPIRAAFDELLPQGNILVWHAPGPVKEGQLGNDGRREVAELLREAFLASLLPDIIHIPSLFEGYGDDSVVSIGRFDTKTPVSVTLHDLIPLLNPEQYLKPYPRFEKHYHRKIESLRQAAVYLAISESSRREGIELLDVRGERVINSSEDTDARFKPLAIQPEEQQRLRQKYSLSKSFVLYSGGTDERKNLPRLIQAYAALPTDIRDKHQLVFVGKMPEDHLLFLKSLVVEAGMKSNDLIFTGYVTDEELVCLYNLCRLFVFPSWHEGFGLPALEAMRCGVPVIGSNTSSLPEVIGLDEALFDPFDVKSITAKLAQALQDESFRNRLSEHGLNQAKKFSWDKTIKRAIATWESLHAEHDDDYERANIYPRLIDALAKQYAAADKANLIDLATCLARNGGAGSKHQLLVDVSELIQKDAKTGIQRVVRRILREWLETPPEGFRVEPVFATVGQGYRYARQFRACFLGLPDDGVQDEPVEAWSGDVFFGLDYQAHVQIARRSFYQAIRRQGVRVKFLVHDLLPIIMPQYFVPKKADVLTSWLEVVAESDGGVCVSQTTANDLDNWLRIKETAKSYSFRVDWSHNGADIDISTKGLPKDAPKVLDILNVRPSFLMVGTLEPRKGHAQTLGAFELLWKAGIDINLVIVGKKGWMVGALVKRLHSHPELNKRLFWLKGISDEYLEKVYALSTCLIAASYGEGFGLPLIEAAQHRLPIIARDIPVFREVAQGYAFYFDDDRSPQTIAEAIEAWLALYNNGKYPKSDTMPWVTWKESAANLLKLLI